VAADMCGLPLHPPLPLPGGLVEGVMAEGRGWSLGKVSAELPIGGSGGGGSGVEIICLFCKRAL